MKKVIATSVLTSFITCGLVYYAVDSNSWRVEEKINKRFKGVEDSIERLTPAMTPTEIQLLYAELFSDRCGVNKINIDIINGMVNGVSISSDLPKLLSANKCLAEGEKEVAVQNSALGKGWSIHSPMMKIYTEIFHSRLPQIVFTSSGKSKDGKENREFIFFGTQFSGKVLGFSKMSDINTADLEKMLGKPVYKSENDSSIWYSVSPSERRENKVQKLYKTKYGCLRAIFTGSKTNINEEESNGKIWFYKGDMVNMSCDEIKEDLQKS